MISILFFICLLAVAMLLQPLCRRLMIPFPLALVILGFAASEFTTRLLNLDIGFRWYHFQTIIFQGLIPILIFHAALTLNVPSFVKNIGAIITMAFPVMLTATVMTGLFLFYAIDHATGFPLIAALLTAATLSATDPAAVLSSVKEVKMSEQVQSVLEGESLLNDAIAIVLFSVLLSIAMQPETAGSWSQIPVKFLVSLFGGILIGLIVAMVAQIVLCLVNTGVSKAITSLLVAYGSFFLAEQAFHFSGVTAVLTAGLGLRYCEVNKSHSKTDEKYLYFWSVNSSLAEMLIFLLAGVTVTVGMFTSQWLAMIYGILAVIIARFLLVYPTFGILGLLPRFGRFSLKEQGLVSWGGIRGTVTLALVLSLPVSLDYHYTIQSIAYGVVLFTLFFQATTIRLFLK